MLLYLMSVLLYLGNLTDYYNMYFGLNLISKALFCGDKVMDTSNKDIIKKIIQNVTISYQFSVLLPIPLYHQILQIF